MTDLPRSRFFDVNDIPKAMRPSVRLNLSSTEVARRVSLYEAPQGADMRGGASRRASRVSAPPQGLSNAPYWAATTSELVEMTIYRSHSLIRVRKQRSFGEYDLNSNRRSDKHVAKRSSIRTFSRRSRFNLQLKAAELQETVSKPDLMITLTYPGDWRTVCSPCICGAEVKDSPFTNCTCHYDYPDREPSGKIVKDKHLKAFRKRLTRYLKRQGLTDWGALWFFEFQARGAPHIHLLLWGVSSLDISPLKLLLSSMWAEIVGHPDPIEYQKHLNAGTKIEKCRAAHFGYALKYAAKMKQKQVPPGFSDIGRFWGVWNDPCKAPVLRSFTVVPKTLKKLSLGLYQALKPHSEQFAVDVLDTFMTVKTFSLRVFGAEASRFLLSYGLPGA